MARRTRAPLSTQSAAYLERFEDFQCHERMSLSFMDNDIDRDQIILGPNFKSLPPLPMFTDCSPRHCMEVLPINRDFICAHTWSAPNYGFNSFPTFDKWFFQWNKRMKKEMWYFWQQAKVDLALKFCCMSFDPVEFGFIGGLCCLWSPSSHCFFLPTGLLIVTLLDLWALTGLPLFEEFCELSVHTCPQFRHPSCLDFPYSLLWTNLPILKEKSPLKNIPRLSCIGSLGTFSVPIFLSVRCTNFSL